MTLSGLSRLLNAASKILTSDTGRGATPEARVTDEEIVQLLAVNLSRIRDDSDKAALLMHLFGRKFNQVQAHCRELAATLPDPITQDRVSVVQLQLLVLS